MKNCAPLAPISSVRSYRNSYLTGCLMPRREHGITAPAPGYRTIRRAVWPIRDTATQQSHRRRIPLRLVKTSYSRSPYSPCPSTKPLTFQDATPHSCNSPGRNCLFTIHSHHKLNNWAIELKTAIFFKLSAEGSRAESRMNSNLILTTQPGLCPEPRWGFDPDPVGALPRTPLKG